ncbi:MULTISPECIES: GGDEF domain-containing protein [Mangrovibacter]|uniref:diguanylate cyclase n=1 Tax=Mangrovibacter plantisponsor TaxID=451513 RepID=A0A317Q1Q9_9ENTR|nr:MULTISPECIES: sensor domain-containing diguanylate cyclase [Mangrovibacter]KEA50002.1 hypothetical protein DT73_25935 [Mangrovibacter sp. MFB070]PWW06976.1 PAS domain S-box-containing protein/diguanylate cyclase (GGDEF)-like protein [Mangrovibacter plantisponsor]
MKNDNAEHHIQTPDSILNALAGVLPVILESASLEQVIDAFTHALGASLGWVALIEQEAQSLNVLVSGCCPCQEQDVYQMLADQRLQACGWNTVVWESGVGKHFFSRSESNLCALESAVLGKLRHQNGDVAGYFFLAFPHQSYSQKVLRNLAAIISGAIKEYLIKHSVNSLLLNETQKIVSQYTTLFSNAPILINSFSADNRCILWNGECQRLFGWSRDELNRFPDPLALFYPDLTVRERVRASVTTVPGDKMQEWYPIDKNGRVLTTLWSNILLPDHSILNIGVDITARKREEQRLARKAITDELTQCLNRAGILAQLNEILLRNSHLVIQNGMSVVMFDLDYFKSINDRWGHSVGDIALSFFGRELQAHPLPGMVTGRLGGEEFLAIFPAADSQQAWRFIEQFRQRLANSQVVPGYHDLRISFSAGILSLRSGEVMPASEVLKQVDEALYGAKRNGRGMSVIVGGSPQWIAKTSIN